MCEAPTNKTPRWLPLLILLCALQPMAVYVLQNYIQPDGMVPTGLSIPDSAIFLHSMEAWPNLDSAYAQSSTRYWTESPTFGAVTFNKNMLLYAVPHLCLYIVLGIITSGVNLFAYELLNSFGILCLLTVIYRLLGAITPQHRNTAFLLFALSGGLGGLHFLVAHFAGWFEDPDYAARFLRMWAYGLAEGAHLNPFLIFPRAYYTLSMAGCLWALHRFITVNEQSNKLLNVLAPILIFIAVFLNARFGCFTLGLITFYYISKERIPCRRTTPNLLAIMGGISISFIFMQGNPTAIENHLNHANMAMWFGPFVVASLLHLLITLPVLHRIQPKALFPRLLLRLGLHYAWAYAFCYLAHQLYYGGFGQFNEGTVAPAVSDAALVLAIIMTAIYFFIHRNATVEDSPSPEQAFIALWLLGLGALSISAFGQGLFLKFGPQRMQVFLWLPLCILTAQGLAQLKPTLRKTSLTLLYSGGITSILIATVCFQAGHGLAPWPNLRTMWMTEADAEALKHLGQGRVIALAPMSDVIVRQKGNPVEFGIGSFNLTQTPFAEAHKLNEAYFSLRDFADEDGGIAGRGWVMVSDTWPIGKERMQQIERGPNVKVVFKKGNAAVYFIRNKVTPDNTENPPSANPSR